MTNGLTANKSRKPVSFINQIIVRVQKLAQFVKYSRMLSKLQTGLKNQQSYKPACQFEAATMQTCQEITLLLALLAATRSGCAPLWRVAGSGKSVPERL